MGSRFGFRSTSCKFRPFDFGSARTAGSTDSDDCLAIMRSSTGKCRLSLKLITATLLCIAIVAAL